MANITKIDERQNEPDIIIRLAAQRRLYDIAKKYNNGLFMFNVVLMTTLTALSLCLNSELLSAYFGFAQKDYSNYLLAVSVIVVIAEKFIVSDQIDNNRETAAKIQEQLDRRIYNWDWNEVIAGNEPREADIIKHGQWFLERNGDKKLRDWYPLRASEAEHLLQVLICQNANLSWDLSLRKRINQAMLWLGFLLFAATFGIAIALDVPASALVVNLISLLGPVCAYGHTAKKENKEFIEQSEHLLDCVEDAIRSTSTGISEAALLKKVENIQEQIFLKRKKSWLIPTFFYWTVREKDEVIMIQNAEVLESRFKDIKLS